MKINNVILPIFNFESTPITLYKGSSKIKRKEHKKEVEYIGKAEIKFKFLPKATIEIDAEYDNLIGNIFDENKIDFSINNFNLLVLVISHQLQLEPVKAKLKLVSRQNSIQISLNQNQESRFVIFHIFDFFDFGIRDKSEIVPFPNGGGYRLDYFFLESKIYEIKIQSIRNTSENIQKIKEDGISRMTQVGQIQKKNGLISIKEYKALEVTLTNFLSFAKGSWINPSCSVGKMEENEIDWYLFNSPKNKWKSLNSWIDPLRNTSSMSELFPLFMDKWESERWKDTLEEVIYWFLNANDGSRGIDAGLILAQTALERLSFEYVVHEKKLLSIKGFKDLWASDKFRILFSSLNIPLDIPLELVHLIKESKKDNWLDAPHALTVIRNSLVHPEHKKHGKYTFDIFHESHTLSLWYLEISILAICEFKGEYSNRIKKGTIEYVPYAKKIENLK